MPSEQKANTNTSPDQELPRAFKGIWIDRNIWLCKDLNIEEKVLLAEINSLDGENGCYADNKYFMNFFAWKERKLQDHLSRLKKLGYIYEKSFDGRKRVLKVSNEHIYEKFSTPEVRNPAPLRCDFTYRSPKIPRAPPYIRENSLENTSSSYTPREEEESPAKKETALDKMRMTDAEAKEVNTLWQKSVAYHKGKGTKEPAYGDAWIRKTLDDVRKRAKIMPTIATGSSPENNLAVGLGLQNKCNTGQINAQIEIHGDELEISGPIDNFCAKHYFLFSDKNFLAKLTERLRIMGIE